MHAAAAPLDLNTLDRLRTAPSSFPTWVIRDAITELLSYRTAEQSAPEVLITPWEDPLEPDRFIDVSLICPHCLTADGIVEVDRSVRWNHLEFDLTEGDLGGHLEDSNHHHIGYACSSCRRPVTIPPSLGDDTLG